MALCENRAFGGDGGMIIPFGPFRGLDVKHAPSNYLDHLRDEKWCQEKHPELVKAIDKEYAIRDRSYAHFYDVPE